MSQARTLSTPLAKNYYLLTAQGATCVLGMAAGMLYFAPSDACAKEETCGAWLSHLSNPSIAQAVFFVAGGVDFGMVNAFFSTDSIPRTLHYLQRFPTTKSKWIQGATVAALTTTQNLQLLIASIGTGSAAWQTILTVSGGVPGALYGTVGLMENEFPYYTEKMKHFLQRRRPLATLTPEQAFQRRQLDYYKNAQKNAVRQAEANWQTLVRQYETLELPSAEQRDPLQYLFQRPSEILEQSCTQRALDYTGKALGVATMLSFTIPFELNTIHVLEKMMPTEILPIALTGVLSISQIYGNIKLTSNTFPHFFRMLHDIAHQQPIQFLPYHMRPKTTLLITSINVVASALSYCVANLITTKDYDGPGKVVLRNAAMIGIAIYHLSGLLHLYEILLARITKDEKAQFVFQTEHALEELKNMRVSTFQENVEAAHPRFRTALNITPFAEEEKADDQPRLHTTLSMNTEAAAEEEEDDIPKPSLFRAWCCFNRPAHKKAHVTNTHSEKLIPESKAYTP